jgi:nucleotide-binding universal stress UspA family protein
MFDKILVGVDGSEPSINAADYAAELAEEKGSELILISIAPEVPILAGSRSVSERVPELQSELERERKTMLENQKVRLNEKFPELKITTVVGTGSPSRNIVELSRNENVDIIIVGNRGRSGVATWMLGSVSRDIVESCTVPVLVVKDQRYCKIR